MSKKILIPSCNLRSSLVDLFHLFMRNHYDTYDDYDYDEDEIACLMSQGYIFDSVPGDGMPFGDDDDDDIVIWPPSKNKSSARSSGTRSDVYSEFWNKNSDSKRKARIIDINTPYSGMEDSPSELDDDGIWDGKEIYYYPDYHDKDNRLEFNSLKSFNDFCEDNGYKLPEHIANAIMYRRISHTCLSPLAREYGEYEIMCEDSYGSLFYEVCDESELN